MTTVMTTAFHTQGFSSQKKFPQQQHILLRSHCTGQLQLLSTCLVFQVLRLAQSSLETAFPLS